MLKCKTIGGCALGRYRDGICSIGYESIEYDGGVAGSDGRCTYQGIGGKAVGDIEVGRDNSKKAAIAPSYASVRGSSLHREVLDFWARGCLFQSEVVDISIP